MPDVHMPFLDNQKTRDLFARLYGRGEKTFAEQVSRYRRVQDGFCALFRKGDIQWFSTPGRSELSGNHTDHNAGRVLAASINLDTIAAVAKTNDSLIRVHSDGFPSLFTVDTSDLAAKRGQKGTTLALIKGIAARFKALGYSVGGFNAYVSSSVAVGSGLSSSASFEVLLADILNRLYNKGFAKPSLLAMIGQYAENTYFGKPCGLMDQMACAVGGIISIDFKDAKKPVVRKVGFDFAKQKFLLAVVDTGGSHADLTDDYASIPAEMKSVAAFFGKKVCREISYGAVCSAARDLRPTVGDRAILRALHFIAENNRVALQVKALEKDDFAGFLDLVNESGDSSCRWLQNCYSAGNPSEQGLSLALALTKKYLDKIRQGACRVHGGGFAGTIQVFLPEKDLKGYTHLMSRVFSETCVRALSIRPYGTLHLNSALTQ